MICEGSGGVASFPKTSTTKYRAFYHFNRQQMRIKSEFISISHNTKTAAGSEHQRPKLTLGAT